MGVNPFNYLVEEVERDFFQKAAEEIAEPKQVAPSVPAPAIPDRFQKLASLVYQSNCNELTKEASESVFSSMDSYEDILNGIAASSYWEPLGMTKSAMDFLTVLEEVGVDDDELVKFAGYALEDTIGTDALIEASMIKESGDSRAIEEIYDELVKEALAAAAIPLFRASSAIGRGVTRASSAIGRGVRAVGRSVGKAATKPGKFRRAGEALQKVAPSVRGKVRGFVDKRRLDTIRAHSQYRNRLNQQRKAIQAQLANASPSKAVQLGEQLKAVNRNRAAITDKMLNIRGKRRKAMGVSNVEKATPPPVKKPPKPSTEGAEKAKDAATQKAPTPDMKKEPGGGLSPGEIERDAKRLKDRGSRYGEDKQKRYGARYVGPEDTPRASAGVTPKAKDSPGYREKKPPREQPQAPEKAPGPRPPKEAVEGKGMGVMDAWSKWGREGWDGLSDIEKSRLIRAGVMAGGGLATYKTVFGD